VRNPRIPRPVLAALIALASLSVIAPAAAAAQRAAAAQPDAVRAQQWWLPKLHVPQAWRTSRGAGVTVAVLSDGVASVPDLAGSVVNGPDLIRGTPGGGFAGLLGTGLASLIAGHGHGPGGASGVLGIAPAARILSLRVTLSPGDPLWSDASVTALIPGAIAAGIRYAVRHGAAVIDLPSDPGQPGAAGQSYAAALAGGSAAERAAVGYALRHGVVLVAPAGDNAASGDAVNFPAAYRGVISAGAFDPQIIKAPFTSRLAYVTLTAPGDGVIAAAPSW
jgi:hypothetical protein